MHRDIEDFSVFPAQLSECLETLEYCMVGNSERRRASRENGMRLEHAVNSEVRGYLPSMGESQGLSQPGEQVEQLFERAG